MPLRHLPSPKISFVNFDLSHRERYKTRMNPLNVIQPLSILLVAAGGAVGCVLRFISINAISRLNPTIFPLGTMVVNIVGSLLIGVVLAKYGHHSTARGFFVTGLLGGYTTFSAFSWDAMSLLHRGHYTDAALYIGGSVVFSLLAVTLGFKLASAL